MSKFSDFGFIQLLKVNIYRCTCIGRTLLRPNKTRKANMRFEILSLIIGLASAWMDIGHLTRFYGEASHKTMNIILCQLVKGRQYCIIQSVCKPWINCFSLIRVNLIPNVTPRFKLNRSTRDK